jgi:hypothetical protein
MSAHSVTHRMATSASGPYAASHLGELTQQIPFEMVDEALAETRSAQRRIPLRFLFDLLRGPAAALSTVVGGVYWRGLLICAIDGTVMSVADSVANMTVFTKQPGGANGGASYHTLRLLAGGRRRHPHHCRRGLRTGPHGTDPLRAAAAAQPACGHAAAGRP